MTNIMISFFQTELNNILFIFSRFNTYDKINIYLIINIFYFIVANNINMEEMVSR